MFWYPGAVVARSTAKLGSGRPVALQAKKDTQQLEFVTQNICLRLVHVEERNVLNCCFPDQRIEGSCKFSFSSGIPPLFPEPLDSLRSLKF